ncbi:kelch domain-containing protein 8A-like isoform X2 [Branchiostoma floridae x Branchiostoma japonicum]
MWLQLKCSRTWKPEYRSFTLVHKPRGRHSDLSHTTVTMATGGRVQFQWENFQAMPTSRSFCTAVEGGDAKLYVVGGCEENGVPIDAFEAYDPAAKSWEKLDGMPTKRAGPAAVSVGQKIVVLGGVSVTQAPLDAVEVFDIVERKWTQLNPLMAAALGIAAVARDGKVMAVGGMGVDTNPQDHLRSLDIENDRWKGLAPMPTARYATGIFLRNDKLYVLGGRQGKEPCAAFEMYDIPSNTWTKFPDLPSKRVFPQYVMTASVIVSLGGLFTQGQDRRFSGTTETFDTEKGETGRWETHRPMKNKRADFVAGVLGEKVVIVGGLSVGGPQTSVEGFDLERKKWFNLPNLNTPLCSSASLLYQGRLLAVGGMSAGPTNIVAALGIK